MVVPVGKPFESWIRTIPAKVPELGAFKLRTAFEPKVSVPTVPPLARAVVRIIVTPAPPFVHDVHSRVAPVPLASTKSPSAIQYVPRPLDRRTGATTRSNTSRRRSSDLAREHDRPKQERYRYPHQNARAP